MKKIECDFCGREIRVDENYYHCTPEVEIYSLTVKLPAEADMCIDCFSKRLKKGKEDDR